jgi:hypothetical protein
VNHAPRRSTPVPSEVYEFLVRSDLDRITRPSALAKCVFHPRTHSTWGRLDRRGKKGYLLQAGILSDRRERRTSARKPFDGLADSV